MALAPVTSSSGAPLAQARSSGWTASGLAATPRQTVEGRDGEIKAELGSRLVEVTGSFDRAGDSLLSIVLADVYLSGWVAQNGLAVSQRSETKGVGIKGNAPSCSYVFPHIMVRGITSRLADAGGNGFELKKKQESDPVILTLLRRPTQLCLVFAIPSQPVRAVTLRVASEEFKILVADEKR
jgi:hypothetical protein